MAPSIADMYGGGDGGSGGRLLSARSGSLNTTMNILPQSGMAAPLVAGLAGMQAGQMEQDQARQAKMGKFLTTFKTLAETSPGAAISFWEKEKGSVGIDTVLTSVTADKSELRVVNEGGMFIRLGAEGLTKPNMDPATQKEQPWIPADQPYLDAFGAKSDAKVKAKTAPRAATPTTSKAILDAMAATNAKIMSGKGDLGERMSATEVNNLKNTLQDYAEQYKQREGKYPTGYGDSHSPAPGSLGANTGRPAPIF